MRTLLPAIQIVISVILIAVVLVQSRGSGFGGAFGTQGAIFRTRRGIELYLFRATVVLAAIFIAVSLLSARAVLP